MFCFTLSSSVCQRPTSVASCQAVGMFCMSGAFRPQPGPQKASGFEQRFHQPTPESASFVKKSDYAMHRRAPALDM